MIPNIVIIPPVTYGHPDPKIMLSLLILINIIGLLVFLIRNIMWLINKPDISYFKYVIWSDDCDFVPDFITEAVVIINGVFILSGIVYLISTLL